MLKPRWSYSSKKGLTQWYGHVGYYDQFVIGQWFSLDADNGSEYWSGNLQRANSVCGCAHGIIVATETRSDGPWTLDFGIYGIDAASGKLLWTNHGSGAFGSLLRALDSVPGYTNGFRDAPSRVVDRRVFTQKGRALDIFTGTECDVVSATPPEVANSPARKLYMEKRFKLGDDMLSISGAGGTFSAARVNQRGTDVWRFFAKQCLAFVQGDYYSYQFDGQRLMLVLGDAPKYQAVKPGSQLIKPNRACYRICAIDVQSGRQEFCDLVNAMHREECRIEAIRGSRILVSCDGLDLVEYEIA